MTIDEKIERLEHVVAAHIEQAKKDYEENRRIQREHQADVAAIWKRMEERDKAWEQRAQASIDVFDDGMAEMRREMAARDQIMDRRIGDLVAAIGALIRGKNGLSQ